MKSEYEDQPDGVPCGQKKNIDYYPNPYFSPSRVCRFHAFGGGHKLRHRQTAAAFKTIRTQSPPAVASLAKFRLSPHPNGGRTYSLHSNRRNDNNDNESIETSVPCRTPHHSARRLRRHSTTTSTQHGQSCSLT